MTLPKGFDFRSGVSLQNIPDGAIVAGHVGDDEIVVVRRGDEFFAVGAHCTHYHGPLADGLVVGDTVRCPWHHACFSLRTGEAAARAGARSDRLLARRAPTATRSFVREKLAERPTASAAVATRAPRSVVIVGGGAAGLAAADMLRRRGYDGAVTMLSADDAPPVDRPNLSKDYLAGDGEGGLDSAPLARVLHGQQDRPAARTRAWTRSTCQSKQVRARERRDARVRRAAARHRRGAGAAAIPGANARIPCTISARSPTASAIVASARRRRPSARS